MSWNSTIAGSAAPLQRTSCRTLTKTSLPVRPSFCVTSAIVDVRSTASPTRTGDRNSQFWVGNNLADFHHSRGNVGYAIPIQEQAIEAARALGFHSSAGFPEYAHMLLNYGRIDDARAAWDRVVADDHETEPQNLAREMILDALFVWANDPDEAVRRLRTHLAQAGELGARRSVFFIVLHLGRMALGTGDMDAAREAAAIAREEQQTAPDDRFVAAATQWVSAIADADDPSAGEAVASAAAHFEEQGYNLLAANAYSDATILAERHGRPEAQEYRARARALYEATSGVPILEALRSGVR